MSKKQSQQQIVELNDQGAFKLAHESFENIIREIRKITKESKSIYELEMNMNALKLKMTYFIEHRARRNIVNVWKTMINEFLGFIAEIPKEKIFEQQKIIKEVTFLFFEGNFNFTPYEFSLQENTQILNATIHLLHRELPRVQNKVIYYETNKFDFPVLYSNQKERGIYYLFCFSDQIEANKLMQLINQFGIQVDLNFFLQLILFYQENNFSLYEKINQIELLIQIINKFFENQQYQNQAIKNFVIEIEIQINLLKESIEILMDNNLNDQNLKNMAFNRIINYNFQNQNLKNYINDYLNPHPNM